MGEHAHYMRGHFDAGKVVVYGPVLAADGAFGMAVLDVDDEAEARRIMAGDPTVVAGVMRVDLAPIRISAARAV